MTTAYKGFDKDFQCLGFQYQIGQTYECGGKIIACENGFHACENPLDVWTYYGPFESRFAVVQLSGNQAKHEYDSKIAAAKITIEAELSLGDFIKKAVDWVIDHCKTKCDSERVIGSSGYSAQIGSSGYSAQIGSSGYSARIGSSGDFAQIGSSGDSARIGSSGYFARIGSSGDCARIGSSGYSARIGSSGYSAQIGSSGYFARIGSSGDSARIGSSGDFARIGSSGDSARIKSEGDKAVIACAGLGAVVQAKVGAWVSVAEYGADGRCLGFATGCIGKNGLLPDTPYKAKNGKLVPANGE